jgi:hypothetical protein
MRWRSPTVGSGTSRPNPRSAAEPHLRRRMGTSDASLFTRRASHRHPWPRAPRVLDLVAKLVSVTFPASTMLPRRLRRTPETRPPQRTCRRSRAFGRRSAPPIIRRSKTSSAARPWVDRSNHPSDPIRGHAWRRPARWALRTKGKYPCFRLMRGRCSFTAVPLESPGCRSKAPGACRPEAPHRRPKAHLLPPGSPPPCRPETRR